MAAPGDNKVGVYVNEGLSWRWVENLAPPSGSGTGVATFGGAIAVDGDTLVIGAPGAGKAFVYARSGESWNTTPTTLTGGQGSQFGAAVAVKGSKIVVGAPQQTVTYKSNDQPADVKTPGESTAYPGVALTKSGAAFVYSKTNGAWGNTSQLLMPDDPGLPESWSNVRQDLPANTGEVYVAGAWRGLGLSSFSETDDNPTVWLGPYTTALFIDTDGGLYDGSSQVVTNNTATQTAVQLSGGIDPEVVYVGYTKGLSSNATAGATFGGGRYSNTDNQDIYKYNNP